MNRSMVGGSGEFLCFKQIQKIKKKPKNNEITNAWKEIEFTSYLASTMYKPTKTHTMSVNVAKPMTIGTKKPAIRSAVCCIGACKGTKIGRK